MVTSTLPIASIRQWALADASSRNLNTIRCSSRWVPASTKKEDAVITPDAGLYFRVHSHALGRRRPAFAGGDDTVRVGARASELPFVLCQNCVTYPPNPPVNIVTYGHVGKYFVVVGTD